MIPKRTLTFIATLLTAITITAQNKGDDIWRSITDWDKFLMDGDVGDVLQFAIIDVDGDGISECFLKGDIANAFLTCSDGNGNVGKEHITLVANSMNTTELCIIHEGDKHFVANIGGCGGGCIMSEYNIIKHSRWASCYQGVTTIDITSENEEEESEFVLVKPGQDSRKISEVAFQNAIKHKTQPIYIDELDCWEDFKSPSSTPSKPSPFSTSSTSSTPSTLHYQSNDTTIIRDHNGYFYAILSSGELAVAPGGAYAGDIVIPSTVQYEGHTYPVTTIRRGAFWKKAGTSNIGTITSITLPESVTLVGADAFRDNPSLTTVTTGRNTRIEVRSFWGCPRLNINPLEPTFAFTGNFDYDSKDKNEQTEALSNYYVPMSEMNDTLNRYTWAFMKYNHSGIELDSWIGMDMGNEDAMACHAWNIDKVRGARFRIRNKANVESMFKGNWQSDRTLMLADNPYVATHEFPMYSRWMYGEDQKPAPEAITQALAKKYNKTVKYSFEVGKLLYTTNEQLIITEFEVKNHIAHYILSWIKDGKIICSFEDTTETHGDDDYSVWNVDDEGSFGIPEILSIARDENGNIELFLAHWAPESGNFYHLVQKGNKFVRTYFDQWYMYVD